MKRRSILLSIAGLLILSCFAFGQSVTQEDAKKVVEKTFSQIIKGNGFKGDILIEETVIRDKDQEAALYIFLESKGGFVILSADKRAYPLLAWADSGTLSINEKDWPPAFKDMIISWIDQVHYIRENNLEPSPEISEMWRKLEEGDDFGFYGTKDVLPLLLTKWSQTCGYNAMCPVDAKGPCGRAVTGCVATAMAQVIRYNEHPVTGVGSKCYTHGIYGEVCADFSSGTYDYSAMSNTGGNTAVAKLIFHCGVSVSMNYGPSSSGAYSGSVATAMRTYFDYTNGLILSKSAYSEDNWASILKRELENNRPIYYSGYGTNGHAFVLDGYKATNHFHINWGWGGSSDGYFYLSSLNPGGMDFTSGQQAIVGMIPTSEFTGLDFSSAIDLGCKFPLAGDLSEGTNYVNYYKNTYPAAIGKEMVYRFTTTLPGRIRIKISNQSQSVNTFLLNYASKDSLLSYGTNGLIVDNTRPATYYIVVESTDGSEPTYTIEALCPTVDADLDIRSAAVNPRFVQSMQSNVALTSNIKNIGNNPSAACQMEYFLSTDTKFNQGTDTLLGNDPVPSLDQGQSTVINSIITMPDSLLPGFYYIMFVADRENTVPEADDENWYPVYVTVPDSGILDCSSSLSLFDGVWYSGNTLSDGTNKVEEYSMGLEMTGPEVIHTFTPLYNGVVKITFVEKSPGMLYAMILPVCNENTVESSLRIYNLTDTVVTNEFYAVAGVQYFIVIDGNKGASGDYRLLVELPKKCPEIKVEYWGKIDMCDGETWPGFWTDWGYSNYQWYIDGAPIPGATNSSYNTSMPGTYHVEITENGCRGASSPISVRSDLRPDTAHITCLDTTIFCHGDAVMLQLDKSVSYPVNWAKDEELIAGATGNSFSAGETGSYSLYTINGACKVKSENSIDVIVLDPPADLGDKLPFPSDKIKFYYTFDDGSTHEGGVTQKSMMIGWDYEPIDDRFGNFWKARYLMGEDEKLYWSDYDTIPDDFTLALWIKTTTAKGGVIAGFFDNPWDASKSEAILYMSDNGKLHFWLSNGASPVELSSAALYNDGNWHYVMIQHDGIMTLEADDGVEKITSAGNVLKESFKGYWTFGGPTLPAGVAETPASMYFNGALDDILCLSEANEFTTPYIVRQPKLNVSLTDPVPSCTPATVSFDMPFSQKGVEYRVWDMIRSLWAPVSAVGDGGDVQFGEAEIVPGHNEFVVVEKKLTTGCETILDTVIVVEVWSVCTLLPENHDIAELKVYPVPAKDILYFESSHLIQDMEIIDNHGKVVLKSSPGKNRFGINISSLPNSIYYYRLTTDDHITLRGKIFVVQ